MGDQSLLALKNDSLYSPRCVLTAKSSLSLSGQTLRTSNMSPDGGYVGSAQPWRQTAPPPPPVPETIIGVFSVVPSGLNRSSVSVCGCRFFCHTQTNTSSLSAGSRAPQRVGVDSVPFSVGSWNTLRQHFKNLPPHSRDYFDGSTSRA